MKNIMIGKAIGTALIIIGILIILGSIGACDTETISLAQTLKQCVVGVAAIAVGRL